MTNAVSIPGTDRSLSGGADVEIRRRPWTAARAEGVGPVWPALAAHEERVGARRLSPSPDHLL